MRALLNRRQMLVTSTAATAAMTTSALMSSPRAQAALPGAVISKSQIFVSDTMREAIEGSTRRPDADKKRDVDRKPAETMAFYGIKAGMKVADLMTSRGYFSGVLAETVGDAGTVYGHNNAWLRGRFKEGQRPLGDLIEKGGFKNIIEQDTELEDLQFPEGQLDAIFMVMFYHDLYWLGVNRDAMNQSIKAALKPGGVYGIIDHHAAPGRGVSDVNKNHRIERYVVIDDIIKSGFELAEETDLLENPKDPLNINVFQQELRGHTHQFVLKFRKPA